MVGPPLAEDDGFTLVATKKSNLLPKKKNRKGKQTAYVEKTISEKIEARRITLAETDILSNFTDLIAKGFAFTASSSCPRPGPIVCLGLGSLIDSPAAQYQFIVLQHLSSLCSTTVPPRIYDPVHATEEKDYFTASAIEPLDNDYDFTLIEPTLLYMPYCPLSLYDDLLRLNWTPEGLSRIVLLGNRLDIYGDPAHPSFASKSEEKKGRYISKASTLFTILRLPSDKPDTPNNLLRDQALQWIPRSTLNNLEASFWSWTPEAQ